MRTTVPCASKGECRRPESLHGGPTRPGWSLRPAELGREGREGMGSNSSLGFHAKPLFFHCIFSAWFLHVSSFVIGLEALVGIGVALLSWSCPWLTGFAHHQCSGMPPLVSSHMSGSYPRKQFDNLVLSHKGENCIYTQSM